MPTADRPLVKAVLAAAIAVVLAADVAAVNLRRYDDGGSPGGVDTPAARELQAVLPELIAFVERTRGLRFLRPPKVELLSDDDFEALLTEGEPTDPADDADEQFDDDTFLGILRALGVIEGPVDLDAVAEQEIDNVVGIYDDRTKVLHARGVSPTPFVKLVLVHELAHALDDQQFGLDRRHLDDEESAAFAALVEGDAGWVEERWYASRSDDEQAAIDAEQGSGAPDNGEPSIFDRLFGFPYAVGPDFVDALRTAGGQARLDAAFGAPPVTTEHVLHPERFLAGEPARPVADPPADGRTIDEGVIGEAFLFLVLDSAVDRAVAQRAAEGWGGDRYVVWRSGGRVCVRFNIVTDTARDMTELVSALRSWAAANPGATVRGSDPVAVTNCA